MFSSCLEKQQKVKALFANCLTDEDRYKKIIELGSQLPALEPQYKEDTNRVHGCQSQMYLHSRFSDGKVYFEAESDALISRGLAYLLVAVYNEETPETILKCPPTLLEDLKITASLTPNRANGLYSLHLKMKQDALKYLIEANKSKE